MRDWGALLKRAAALMEESGALLTGDFVLASGRRSSYYFDSKLFSLDGEGQLLAGELLLEVISPYDPDGFGGMAVSAVPLVGAVARAALDKGLPRSKSRGFFVREKPKEHGTEQVIEGIVPPEGSRVVILDDVVTTGGSAQKAVDAAKAKGLEVILVATLVERHEGGGETFRKQRIPFVSIFRTTKEGELVPATPEAEPIAATV